MRKVLSAGSCIYFYRLRNYIQWREIASGYILAPTGCVLYSLDTILKVNSARIIDLPVATTIRNLEVGFSACRAGV